MTWLPKIVMISGAVSPIETATPSSIEVIRPERAVGSTTDHTVRHSGAASAIEASRRSLWTTLRTSSVPRVTVGSKMMASARAPAKPE